MTAPINFHERIEQLASRDCRYHPEAYHFVFSALDYVLDTQEHESEQGGRRLPDDRHVAAADLLDGLRDFALEQYGPLARLVLEQWGLYRTEDFGEIVFGLVQGRLLNKQDTDRKSDFRNGFNFREAFDRAYQLAPKPTG